MDIISGSSLSFEVDEKPAFVVPLKDVSQATTGESFLYGCVHHEHVQYNTMLFCDINWPRLTNSAAY